VGASVASWAQRESLLEIGARHPISGARNAIDSLLNVIQAACDWDVRRVSVASTIGVMAASTPKARCARTYRCR
jgi:isopropylmalate/homocitrate/citramalate synthase